MLPFSKFIVKRNAQRLHCPLNATGRDFLIRLYSITLITTYTLKSALFFSMPPRLSGHIRPSTPVPTTNARNAAASTSTLPAVIQSPPRKRARRNQVHQLPDDEVWGFEDDRIIEGHRSRWKSDAYSHFNITLRRDTRHHIIYFVFTCRNFPSTHLAVERERTKLSQGTTNLQNAVKVCNRRRGVITSPLARSGPPAPVYSEAGHRALIALRCAKLQRPANMVVDPEYKQEVEMLRPGTIIPNPSTVARDIRELYNEGSKQVRAYFSVSIVSILVRWCSIQINFDVET